MKKVTLKYSGLGPVSMPNNGGGVYTIKPGVCVLDVEIWDQMKGQPDIVKMLERGLKSETDFDKKTGLGNLVVVGQAGDDSKKNDSSDDVARVPGNQKDAKKLVSETEDTGLLNDWLETEDRAGVKNAIEKQLKAIDAYREENGEKEE